jgi:uncharacterized NAD-dependent epimerase/dehydratase family protein
MSTSTPDGHDGDSSNAAIVYSEGHFGGMDGKTANGLIRFSTKYRIVAVIDSDKAGQDTGQVLDGKANGIPICRDLVQALDRQKSPPRYFIFGMAPLGGVFSDQERQIMFQAMENGMHLVNGLHEFLNDDEAFVRKARSCGVRIFDVRKPKATKDLCVFSGSIFSVTCPKIAVLGTDSAIGKRTTATILTQSLQRIGLNAVMVATGQTGLIQGAKYGVALDAITEQFISGEMEAAVVAADRAEKPDLLIIEGQGALSHPAYLSSCFIIRGSRPDAIILQHAPMRKMLGDYPQLPMPTLESETKLIEAFSGSKVIAIAINHEQMTERDVDATIEHYEAKYGIAATDVLASGAAKLAREIFSVFPDLRLKLKTTTRQRAANDTIPAVAELDQGVI